MDTRKPTDIQITEIPIVSDTEIAERAAKKLFGSYGINFEHDIRNAFLAAIREARASRDREVEELKADKQRLDWLSEQIGPGYAGAIVEVANLVPRHGGNFREAIDKAMLK